MSNATTQIKSLISSLRSETEPNSISPERIGIILQKLLDINMPVEELQQEIRDTQKTHQSDIDNIVSMLSKMPTTTTEKSVKHVPSGVVHFRVIRENSYPFEKYDTQHLLVIPKMGETYTIPEIARPFFDGYIYNFNCCKNISDLFYITNETITPTDEFFVNHKCFTFRIAKEKNIFFWDENHKLHRINSDTSAYLLEHPTLLPPKLNYVSIQSFTKREWGYCDTSYGTDVQFQQLAVQYYSYKYKNKRYRTRRKKWQNIVGRSTTFKRRYYKKRKGAYNCIIRIRLKKRGIKSDWAYYRIIIRKNREDVYFKPCNNVFST